MHLCEVSVEDAGGRCDSQRLTNRFSSAYSFVVSSTRVERHVGRPAGTWCLDNPEAIRWTFWPQRQPAPLTDSRGNLTMCHAKSSSIWVDVMWRRVMNIWLLDSAFCHGIRGQQRRCRLFLWAHDAQLFLTPFLKSLLKLEMHLLWTFLQK